MSAASYSLYDNELYKLTLYFTRCEMMCWFHQWDRETEDAWMLSEKVHCTLSESV